MVPDVMIDFIFWWNGWIFTLCLCKHCEVNTILKCDTLMNWSFCVTIKRIWGLMYVFGITIQQSGCSHIVHQSRLLSGEQCLLSLDWLVHQSQFILWTLCTRVDTSGCTVYTCETKKESVTRLAQWECLTFKSHYTLIQESFIYTKYEVLVR